MKLSRPSALLAACLFSGCVAPAIEQREGTIVYPSDLIPPHPSVLLWPADAEGSSFRFVFQDADGWFDDDAALSETSVPPDWKFAAMLPTRINAAIVLLPPGASAELRQAAHEIIGKLEAERSGVSSSILVTGFDVLRIEDVPTLASLLEQSRLRHRTERPGSFADAMLMMQFVPRWIVMPVAGDAGEFVVIGNLWEKLEELEELIFDAQGVLEFLDSHFGEELWSLPTVAMLTPRGVDDSRLAACDALAERIPELRPAHGMLLRGSLEAEYEPGITAGLITAELVNNYTLDRLLVGPVVVRLAYQGDRSRSLR